MAVEKLNSPAFQNDHLSGKLTKWAPTISIVFLLILSATVRTGSAASTPSSLRTALLTEWTVPTASSGPWGLALGPSGGCCWFVEYYANKLGHLDPASGLFEEWQIPTRNANPYSLAVTRVAGKVMVWGTEFGSDTVFAFFPDSGTFLEYFIQHYNSGVGYVSIEPTTTQMRIWFTETLRNANGEFVYDPKTENVTLYEDTFPAAVGGGAYGVYAGVGSVWFAGFSSIVRWDRAFNSIRFGHCQRTVQRWVDSSQLIQVDSHGTLKGEQTELAMTILSVS